MLWKSILAVLLASLAMAAPAQDAKKPYIAVSLFFHINPPHGHSYQSPGPTELYHLFNYDQLKDVTKISFEHDYAYGIDINQVECQAYSDALGQKPLGTFTNKMPLKFDMPTTVGSGICYAVPS